MERNIYDVGIHHDIELWKALRLSDITSSDVASLFGISDYKTPLRLWTIKDQRLDEKVDNDYVKWGNRLQPAIAQGFAEDYGFEIEEFQKYISLEDKGEDMRIGSSFDYLIKGKADFKPTDDMDIMKNRLLILSLMEKHGEGILEIKNVDYFKNVQSWTGNEATPYIELQIQHQMLVSGKKWAVIGGLVGGNNLKVLVREYNEEIGREIIKRVKSFWKSIKDRKAPAMALEDIEDKNSKSEIYDDEIIEASENSVLEDLAERYETDRLIRKSAGERMERIKDQIFDELGDIKGAYGHGWKINTYISSEEKPEVRFEVRPEHVGEVIILQTARKRGSRVCKVTLKD
ncbi:exonuclease [Caudoviricetes sp.]|nr:exonuclease [Caudoviricetes sp.]